MAKHKGMKRKLKVCRIRVTRAIRRSQDAATVTLNFVGSEEDAISISSEYAGEPSELV
jgi:hypothetical protein